MWGSTIFVPGTLITWHRYRLTLKKCITREGKTRGWKPVPGSQIVGKTRKTEKGTRKYERVIALS